MILQSFIPSSILRDYVKSFGIVHFVFPAKETIPPKAFSPKPQESIDFFLRDPEYIVYPGDKIKHKRAVPALTGQHTCVTNRYVGQEFLFFQISFQPGALFRLTGIPSYELTNTFIEAEAVFSKEILLTEERLKNAASYIDMIAIAESFLLRLIRDSKKDLHPIDITAKLLLQSTQRPSLDWLANESCLSAKQFERKFYERVGISPSLFARLIRFDKAFTLKNKFPGQDWLSIALQCGYYDYQHLVRDYKVFTGLTPTGFLELENQAPERLLGLQEL